jgi:hypothetical protein
MSADQTSRKLSLLFCKITMKLEDLHPVACRGMSQGLKLPHSVRLARRVQHGLVEMLVLAASAENLARTGQKLRKK